MSDETESKYKATRTEVFNRGRASVVFLAEMVEFGKTEPATTFEPRPSPPGRPDPDIFAKVKPELGPWESDNREVARIAGVDESCILPFHHRRAVMLETMRVLALFESGANHKEGVDTSRLGNDTPENSEAGAWQVSYDARRLAPELAELLRTNGITNGIEFQRAMKFNHTLSMQFVARLMRHNSKHNGPLYKGPERDAIRASLRGEKHSIYPYLSRDAVVEFMRLLAA